MMDIAFWDPYLVSPFAATDIVKCQLAGRTQQFCVYRIHFRPSSSFICAPGSGSEAAIVVTEPFRAPAIDVPKPLCEPCLKR